MKKLLVLLMVLGMVSFANAGLIFTVDGDPQPPEIVLAPSETIELDLHLDTGQTLKGYNLMYELTNEQAEFVTAGIAFPWASDFPGKINAQDTDGICSWVEITAGNFMSWSNGPLDLMQGLLIHCLDETPVDLIITVSGNGMDIDGGTVPAGTVVHTLHIEQPEPMTIALLGLGGLFLRRRK